MDSEIEAIKTVYSQSRLLFVCRSCFRLKPPVLVELKTSSTCSWCSKATSEDEKLLVFEYLTNEENDVEYLVVRKCYSQSIDPKTCKKFMGLRWKPCPNGEDCSFAHSDIEKRIWSLEKRFDVPRSEVIQRFQQLMVQERKPLKGEFHCVVCSKNLPNGKDFSVHCDSFLHQKLMRSTESKLNKYRPLPGTEALAMCSYFQNRNASCRKGDKCEKAHSAAELKEWKFQLQLRKEKLRYADEAGLMPFVESIIHQYKTSSSSATVLNDSLPGIKVRIRNSRSQRLVFAPNKPATCKWRLKIHCYDHTEKLNHAAFHITEGARNAFRICCFRRGKHSLPAGHLNFKVSLEKNNSLNLFDGDGTYEVRFEARRYGSFSSYLFLEFRNSPRPVLMIEFHVEVSDSLTKYSAKSNMYRTVDRKVPSWERRREIIRWDEDENDPFSVALRKINNQYKPPSAAIGYTAKNREKSVELYNPNQLNISNYIQEMHSFLYREEEARIKHLNGPRLFVTALSKSYKSAGKGICNCPEKQLFGVFELPVNLSRDTDEGMLILESCKKVLIGRRKESSNSPVYEALIEETFVDHVVILLSENCVTAWNLECGRILKAEIQFQLDRDRFCRCHWALDQLKANNQLALVCPGPYHRRIILESNVLSEEERSLGLDEFQAKVFSFLQSNSPWKISSEGIPLFVVQGSFGTGKTHTICKCIKYILEHDKTAKILICTHSNSAANLYIENNFTDNVGMWKRKVLRVVFHGRRTGTFSHLVKQYCLIKNGRFYYPSAQDIASRQVVVTTFETALSLGSLGTAIGAYFTHIFLDEVAQVMEPVAIIPLTLAISPKTKIVIAGDHKQMTEKIHCINDIIDLHDADFTLLSRMYKTYSQMYQLDESNNRHPSDYLVVLRNNYRCVLPILTLIELLFYARGLMQSCSTVKPLHGFNPIQFHDVEGRCELDQLTGGYRNEAEASYIKDLVKELLVKYKKDLEPEDVVVLASYRDQVNVIREKLRLIDHHRVPVHSIRDIQGLEYKIVILSCVHKREARQDTDGENYGFLSDRNMLNTAFTRSKLGIIAVGHAVTLWTLGKCDVMWQNYIHICSQFRGLHNRQNVESIMVEAAEKEFSALNPSAREFIPGQKALPGTSNEANATPQLMHNSSEAEDEYAQFDDFEEQQEETLPLQDDILDDIIRNIIGINPEKLVIKVDSAGVEFPTEKTEQDENDQSLNTDTDDVYCDFSLDHLENLVTYNSQEYKKCTLQVKTWHTASAVLHEPDDDFDSIQITTKQNLGRSFDQDEVVVHIEKKVLEKESEDDRERMTVYGKVVGTISRYRDPQARKFICFPDPHNPGIMCPIDKKITKFLISGRRNMSKNDLKVPICKLEKDKNGKETAKIVRVVKYDRFSMTLQKSKHFVVRFIKWPPHSYYPVGYVSEEIKPKDFEAYYSLLHDVPDLKHENLVEKEAAELSNQDMKKPRRDLEHLFVFTIDPEGSTDLDDAISVEKCKKHDDCWEIGIHIADVASVIPADSDVDLEARKRGTSFYSGDVSKDKDRKVVHMLPSSLSSQKCSLLPDGKKRLTISIFIHSTKLPVITPTNNNEANKDLNLPTPQLTWVRSRRQLTYKDAEIALRHVRENGVQDFVQSNDDNLADQLFIIWNTMMRLRFQRLSWASFFQRPDFNSFNKFCDEASAHMLIEEAMITCNSCCSHYLQRQGCDFLLKVQNPPFSDESIKWREENLEFINRSLFLQECVQHLHGEDEVERMMEIAPQTDTDIPVFPHVLMKIAEALKRNDLETAMILFSCDSVQPASSPGNSNFIRIQHKAQLQAKSFVSKTSSPGSVTHFSLRLPLYSWFTSPIRRYSDIHSQRLILRRLSLANNSRKNNNVLEISQPKELNLKELSTKLMQRSDDAKKYEKDVRLFSYALSLSHDQHYQAANITQADEGGVELNFLELRDMTRDAFRLRYSDLKLHDQTEENISWKIRYFDAGGGQASSTEVNNFSLHSFYTSTVVSSADWNNLVLSSKSLAFDWNDPMNDHARETLKSDFERLLRSQKRIEVCNRTSTRRSGPCNNEDCGRQKICRDYLDGLSKLGISHYRVITMPLALGTPLLVQLHCGVRRGIGIPSIQLLSVAQDLDICASHNRQPVETFAAGVKPILDKKFGTIEEYIEFWLPLLRMEGIYSAVKDGNNSIILQNISVIFNDTDVRLQGSFTLSHEFCKMRTIAVSVDDFVCIRVKCFNLDSRKDDVSRMSPHKSSFTWVLHGVITNAEQMGKILEISFAACVSLVGEPKIPTAVLLKGRRLKAVVELVQLGVSYRGIVKSLRRAAKMCEKQDIVPALCLKQSTSGFAQGDRIQKKRTASVAQVLRSVGRSTVPGMKYALNEGQITQIKRALQEKITLIQGPPGTGKSFVGAHLTYYFYHCNKLVDEESPKKILYCGPSNKSVDVVAEYLLNSQLKVLRVYGSTFEEEDFPNPLKPAKTGQETGKRPSKKIISITLHHVIRQKGKPFAEQILEFDRKFSGAQHISYHEDYLPYKNLLKKAKLHEFIQHDVIICTCTAATIIKNSLSSGMNKGQVKKAFKFAQCIIDECAMCSEPETLAPIVASEADQIVLIGDHMQLQPIIQCRRAKEFGLAKSLFERKHEVSEKLTNQYRMDPGICDFPSQQFYEGDLITDQSVLDREAARSFRFCHPAGSKNTAVFCHVAGIEQVNYSSKRGGESSYYNETEARVVIRILMYLYRNKVPLSNIMILSPYSAQVTTIRDIISQERSQLSDVHVGTVVTSQGSESDFVILSTVRSRPSSAIEDQANVQWRRKFIGFVSDPHQINVAITRAKSGLCIVGNQNLLEKDTETWANLLDNYRSRGSVVYFDDPNAPWNA